MEAGLVKKINKPINNKKQNSSLKYKLMSILILIFVMYAITGMGVINMNNFYTWIPHSCRVEKILLNYNRINWHVSFELNEHDYVNTYIEKQYDTDDLDSYLEQYRVNQSYICYVNLPYKSSQIGNVRWDPLYSPPIYWTLFLIIYLIIGLLNLSYFIIIKTLLIQNDM